MHDDVWMRLRQLSGKIQHWVPISVADMKRSLRFERKVELLPFNHMACAEGFLTVLKLSAMSPQSAALR